MRSSIRSVYLLVVAGAEVSSDHLYAINNIQDKLLELSATEHFCENTDSDDLLVAISVLEKICQVASSPRTLADLCRLCLRAALRTYIGPGPIPHSGGWRLGLANLCRRGYSPYISKRAPIESFQERLSRLELPKICKEFVALGELKAGCERFSDWLLW